MKVRKKNPTKVPALPETRRVRFVVAFETNDMREAALDRLEDRLAKELRLQFGHMATLVRIDKGEK